MQRVACILFLLFLSAAPPNVAATQDPFYQMLGTGPLAVRLDNQWADDKKSWKQSDLLATKAWDVLSENEKRMEIAEIVPCDEASGSYVEKSIVTQVPEPTTIILFGFGLLVLAGSLRKTIRLR
jgi:hypothetical protein